MGQERKEAEPHGRRVTFRGRGLGVRTPARLTLLVCPLCSQRNGDRMALRGVCEWCAYEPSKRDEEPV